MIAKLNRRIFWMLFSRALVITAVLLVCLFQGVSWIIRSQTGTALQAAFYLNETPPEGEEDAGTTTLPIFRVITDGEGEILGWDARNGEVTEDHVRRSLQAAREENRPAGSLSDLHLHYAVRESAGQIRYAFVDVTTVNWQYRMLICACVLLFAGAAGPLYLLACHSARLAVNPVEEELNRQRRFAADASHELKTPLSVMMADLNILKSHPDHTIGEEQRWLDSLQEEADRLHILMEELLYLARTEQQPAVRQDTVNFSETVWECLLHFESLFFEAGVQMEMDIQEGLLVTGDGSQLQTLVSVLLDNACKYTPQGGRILVRLSSRDKKLRLTVNNKGGPPIPPETLDHLFERFYRGDQSRRRDEGSYGLGLAIGQAVVHNHGGTISAASTQEEGTTFTVQLPLGKEQKT